MLIKVFSNIEFSIDNMRRDLIALPEDSRVWVYAADKEISDHVSDIIKEQLYDFSLQWRSHGQELDCYAQLFHQQFLVFVADSSALPSGCSIDSSVHVIKELSQQHGIDFFNRMVFQYFEDEHIRNIKKSDLKDAYNKGMITNETLFFNNLVTSKSEFINDWIIPLSDSWHSKFV